MVKLKLNNRLDEVAWRYWLLQDLVFEEIDRRKV